MDGAPGSSSAAQRLAVLSRHLEAVSARSDGELSVISRANTKAEDEEARAAPGGGRGTLTVLDNRTGKKYTVGQHQGVPFGFM